MCPSQIVPITIYAYVKILDFNDRTEYIDDIFILWTLLCFNIRLMILLSLYSCATSRQPAPDHCKIVLVLK